MPYQAVIGGKEYQFEQLKVGDKFAARKWLKQSLIREVTGDLAFSPIALIPAQDRADIQARMFQHNVTIQDVLRSDEGRLYLVYLSVKPGIPFEQWCMTILPEEQEALELLAFSLCGIKLEQPQDPLVQAPPTS